MYLSNHEDTYIAPIAAMGAIIAIVDFNLFVNLAWSNLARYIISALLAFNIHDTNGSTATEVISRP